MCHLPSLISASGGSKRLASLFASQDRIDHALPTSSGVVLFQTADENRYLATLGHGLFHQIAAHPTRHIVVHPDVAQSIGIGCIAVVRDQLRVLGRFVEQFGLVLRIDGTDRDAVSTFGQKIFDHAFLIADPLGGHQHLDVGVKLLATFLNARFSDHPERSNAGGDVGNTRPLVGAT